MTWSYSGNPSNSDLDQVRFLIGDTDTTDQLVTDEEATWALSEGSVYNAAAELCDAIAAKFSRKVDKSVGDLRLSYSKLSEQYSKKSKQLRSRGAFGGIAAYAGGISVSDKETAESNTDRVSPSITRDMDDYDKSTDPDDRRNY